MTATTPDTYNGWTNYETWAVSLWIDNNEPSYRRWREIADAIREAGSLPIILDGAVYGHREPRHILADRLSDAIGELAPDLGASMWSDLLGRALSRVNWTEIADHMLEP